MEGLGQFACLAAQNAARTSDPGRFSGLAKKLSVLCDSDTAKAAQQGPPVACKKGCAHCCYRLVTATAPEALRIAELLRTQGAERVRQVLSQLEAYEQAIAPLFQGQSVIASPPCAFLEEEFCTIYEARPFTCRGLNSVDADVCISWRHGPLSAKQSAEIKEATVAALAEPAEVCEGAILRSFAQEGRPSGRYDLAGAVLTLLRGSPEAMDWRGARSALEKVKTASEFDRPGTPLGPAALELSQNSAFADYYRMRVGNPDGARAVLGPLGDHPARFLAALDMPEVYESTEQLEETWQNLGEGIEALAAAKLPARETFDILTHFSPFFMAYSGKDVRPYMKRLTETIFHQYAERAFPQLTAHLPSTRQPGRFRLGYAGYRLTDFNGSRWAIGWLRNHGPDIETFAFNLNESESMITKAWRRFSNHYYHLPIPAPQAATFIRQMDLDALIIPDVGMDGINLQLASLRLARKQFTAWGHPVTSGAPLIDGYLSSALMEPANGDEHYTERLFRLPGSGLCYLRGGESAPDGRSRAELGLPYHGYLFCPQVHCKLLPARDHLYQEIAERLGKPVLFVGPASLARRLGRVSPMLQVIARLPEPDYLRALALADTILDPPDWNGGNSTIEALSLGRPVVTLPGDFMRGRHSLAFHRLAGVEGLIAADERDYVALACDANRQAAAMAGLNADALFDDVRPVRALDEILLSEFPG